MNSLPGSFDFAAKNAASLRLEQGTGLVFQFDLGQIGTLTPSPVPTPSP
ncbi:MAG: hypothetical protein FWE41_09090 [Coriobacteriia bacterium]|nr:hypothetical protein [Coriobacteriia bacterium]